MTFKQIKNDGQVDAYVCKENPAIRIEVARGSFSHNRPTGYNLYFNGELINWFLTLGECKESSNGLMR